MPAKYASGRKAVGICQRCSKKRPRRELVEDGYFPGLMVCPDCFDARHPQERLPKLFDPVTIYKPAPDDVGDPPVLSVSDAGLLAHLAWTEAAPINARIDSYDVYQSVDGADPVKLTSLPITYDIFMAITAQTLVYDVAMTPGTVNVFFVVANTDPQGPDVLSSNRVQVITQSSVVVLPPPVTGALALVGSAPLITSKQAAATGALALIGSQPSVSTTVSTSRIPSTGSLSLNGNTPVVSGFQPMFVAGAGDATSASIMKSTDGINWSQVTTPANLSAFGIAWSPALKLFVVVGGIAPYTSPDAVTWTARTNPAGTTTWLDVTWSPALGLFVAVSHNATNSVMTSPDGINWTLQTTPNRQWHNVRWSASLGMFAAGAIAAPNNQSIMTSPDGVTWTLRVGSVYYNPAIGFSSYKMAVDPSGYFISSDRGTFGVLKSTDGITWTSTALGTGGAALTDIEGNGAGVVVGSRIISSTNVRSTNDGASWATTVNGGGNCEDIVYSADLGRWVGVCNVNAAANKKAIYSSDGNTWGDGSTPTGADTLAWGRVIYVNMGA